MNWTPYKRRNFLNTVGPLCFSDQWKSAMAEELGVSVRTVIRYSDGESPITDQVMDRLYSVMKRHIKVLKRHLRELREAKK